MLKDSNLLRTTTLFLGVALLLAACNLPAPVAPALTPTTFSFPTATGSSSQGVIFGVVWQDSCIPPSGGEALPSGCIDPGDAGIRANGIFEANEPGIADVTLRLGSGACPSSGLQDVQTDDQGRFEFAGLAPGDYCVSADASQAANRSVLGQGIWTRPETALANDVAQVPVTLAEADGEQVDFGWDPGGTLVAVSSETPTPTATAGASASPTATVTPTGTLPATAAPGDPTSGLGNPDFQDEFNSAANWPLYEDEHVQFEVNDGRMEMTAFNADFWDGWVFPARSTSADFYAEGEFQFGSCSGRDNFGIIGRGDCEDGSCRAYLYAATCDGRYNLRIWDGEGTTYVIPLTQTAAFSGGSNSTVRLGMWMQDSTIQLFANGTKLADIQDSTYDSGGVGMFIGAAATPNFQAWVDSFRYWALP